ncbi:MAG: hypothetical protein N2C14_15725 [Planctomycetales bacterium]
MSKHDDSNPYAAPRSSVGSVSGFSEDDEVAQRIRQSLSATRRWLWVVSAFGFLVSGVEMLCCLAMVATSVGDWTSDLVSLLIFYGAWIPLGLVPSIFLVTCALRIGRYLQDGSSETLLSVLHAQESVWRAIGVMLLLGVFVPPLLWALLFF